MARPLAKLLTGFFVAAAVLLVVALVFTLSQPSPAPPPLPNPNGYDDFVRAGGMVADNTREFTTISEAQLQALVRTNADALKFAEIGFTHECRAPLEGSGIEEGHVKDLMALKRLAQAWAAKGRLAEMEDRPADAAEAYLSTIRLGSAVGQGGLLIDALVSIAIEAIGAGGLEKVVPKLNAKQCRKAAVILEACDAQREPMDRVLARERTWARRTFGLRGQIARLVMFKSLRQSEQRATAKVQAQQTRLQRLLIQLAVRAYELEKGGPPKNLAALVPSYLQAVPQDPRTGTNMVYQP